MNRTIVFVSLLLSLACTMMQTHAQGEATAGSATQGAANMEAPSPLLELKHEKRVDALALAPDGTLLASATAKWKENKATGSVHLWSLADGQLKTSWEVGVGTIKALAFSPDGKTLATGGSGAIRLWNLQGQLEKTFNGHTRDVESLTFSPDGKTLASGSLRPWQRNLAGELFVWDVGTGTKREILMNDAGGATAIAFSPNGTQLAATHSQFTVGVWDVATLQLKTSVGDESTRGVITALAFSPDGKVLATGDMGHELKLWDAHSGQLQATLLKLKENWNGAGPSGVVNGVVFCRDGHTLISAGTNQEGPGGEAELLIWNWPARQITASLLPPPTYGISRFAASNDGQRFATVESLSPIVKVWRTPKAQ